MKNYLKKLSPYMVLKGIRYLRHFGLKEFLIRLQERMEPEEVPYGPWYENYRPTPEELEKQRKLPFGSDICFSILVPCFHTPVRYLREMAESVFAQTYPNWQLCIVNASPGDSEMRTQLEQYAKDPRVKVVCVEKNLGISGNTNRALEIADGDFVCLLDHDDVLSEAALWQIARYLKEHPGTEAVYTDEDKIREDGLEHFQPHLKPDFNLDLLRSNNYICHLFAVRREIALLTGGFRDEYNGAQDYDFIFRCCEAAAVVNTDGSSGRFSSGASAETGEMSPASRMNRERIGHVPEILYHWRVHRASTADNPASKQYAYEAGKKAIEDHLKRCGCHGTAEELKDLGFYRVHYDLPPDDASPLVSVIIPSRNQAAALERCISSLEKTTGEIDKEILIIENNSDEQETFELYRRLSGHPGIRMLRWNHPFNYSAINNFGVRRAKGKYLLFLNNDIEAPEDGWLSEMLSVCCRPDVGAVGARLYYPDDTIQHAGIVMGIGGVAGSMFVDMKRERTGYLHKAALLQDLSAVTAACMLMKKDLFLELGGFEEKLAVAFNDVDLCLRINEAGYRVVYDPYAQLYHDESRSRGAEDTKQKVRRFQNEIEYMRTNWISILKNGDPYYNKNLSLTKWNYSLRNGERMR